MRVEGIIGLVMVTACAGEPGHAVPFRVRDSAGVRVAESAPAATDVMPHWRLSDSASVVFQGAALYDVQGAIQLSNGEYVVANAGNHELLWYDEAGEFVRAAGREGGGPAEFLALAWVGRTAADSVLAWDVRRQAISVFTPDGRHARSWSVPVRGVVHGIFPDGALLLGQFRAGSEGFVRRPITLWRIHASDAPADSLGTFPGAEEIVTRQARGSGFAIRTQTPPFGRDGVFAVRSQHVLVASQDRYEVREYTTTGALFGLTRLDRPLAAVTAEDIATYQRIGLEGYTGTDVSAVRRFFAEQEYPEHYPAHSTFIVDRRGNLWVRDYPRPGEPAVAWLVFAPSGELATSVLLPAGLEVYEIGDDYLLGKWRGESDVELVGVHGLLKP